MCDWNALERARLDRDAARCFAEKAEAYGRWFARRLSGAPTPPGTRRTARPRTAGMQAGTPR